jgi:hypothetical protein
VDRIGYTVIVFFTKNYLDVKIKMDVMSSELTDAEIRKAYTIFFEKFGTQRKHGGT